MFDQENVKVVKNFFKRLSAQDMDGMDELLNDDFKVDGATGAEGPMNK
jgi:ketosteroid isomerase-like protein